MVLDVFRQFLVYNDICLFLDNSGCSVDQFQCSDGSCIFSNWVCDDYNDCPDNEDEDQSNCHLNPGKIFYNSVKHVTLRHKTSEYEIPFSFSKLSSQNIVFTGHMWSYYYYRVYFLHIE